MCSQKEHPEAAVAKFLRCASSLCPLLSPCLDFPEATRVDTIKVNTITHWFTSAILISSIALIFALRPINRFLQKEHPEAAVAKFLRCASSLCPLHSPSTCQRQLGLTLLRASCSAPCTLPPPCCHDSGVGCRVEGGKLRSTPIPNVKTHC